MIKWLKDLFKPSETNRMVPISQIEADRAREKREEQDIQDEMLDIESQIKEYDEINSCIREYVYVGDGMMEEVTRTVPRDTNAIIQDNLRNLQAKARSTVSRQQALSRSSRSSSNYNSSSSTPYIYGGSDDSGSSYSYDSGSCDSGSSSCD